MNIVFEDILPFASSLQDLEDVDLGMDVHILISCKIKRRAMKLLNSKLKILLKKSKSKYQDAEQLNAEILLKFEIVENEISQL